MFYSTKGKQENPKLYSISREVFEALNWSVLHNPLQKDVAIEELCLDSLPEDESIEVKNITLEQEEEGFKLPGTGPSNNDQFDDYRVFPEIPLNALTFLPSSVKQAIEAKYQSLLWKQFLLLNWILEINISMNLEHWEGMV